MILYKHENNTDVAMCILNRFYVPQKKLWKLKVEWWNIGSRHDPWPMGIVQRLNITADEWKKWHLYPQR